MRLALALLALHGVALAAEPGFETLFDGSTLSAWTVLPREQPSGGWRVEDNVLLVEGRPGNLATSEQFADFDLRLEWKLAELGNSGVFYRFAGTGNPAVAAIEYQLADNARTASQQHANRKAGSAYGLYAPQGDPAPHIGAWNTLRVVARGNRVEHWLNGQKVVEFDLGSPDFAARARAAGKDEAFAQARSGRIVLQDHASRVWFRNIRIRRLE
ncbi:MAG: DUF1080 domain-containing protein [Bryobacterales bacterium]|nr:DUF1080 domain-containing protein [Bryobacterales bacterium]MDE0621606.1 DUF1080 domain-containing protein [Bryobacterales bacterium]